MQECAVKGVSLVPGVTEVARRMKMVGVLEYADPSVWAMELSGWVGRKGAKRLPLWCTSGSRSAVRLNLWGTSPDLELSSTPLSDRGLLCQSSRLLHHHQHLPRVPDKGALGFGKKADRLVLDPTGQSILRTRKMPGRPNGASCSCLALASVLTKVLHVSS